MQDNALKQWVFDAMDGSARLLRFRSGHAAPPTCLTHYGEAGTRLLSAGRVSSAELNQQVNACLVPEQIVAHISLQRHAACMHCNIAAFNRGQSTQAPQSGATLISSMHKLNLDITLSDGRC